MPARGLLPSVAAPLATVSRPSGAPRHPNSSRWISTHNRPARPSIPVTAPAPTGRGDHLFAGHGSAVPTPGAVSSSPFLLLHRSPAMKRGLMRTAADRSTPCPQTISPAPTDHRPWTLGRRLILAAAGVGAVAFLAGFATQRV